MPTMWHLLIGPVTGRRPSVCRPQMPTIHYDHMGLTGGPLATALTQLSAERRPYVPAATTGNVGQ
jgi:hypothetical protein